MSDSPTSKQALHAQAVEELEYCITSIDPLRDGGQCVLEEGDIHWLRYALERLRVADEPKANHPPCIYRNGCVRPDCTEHCMGFRREAEPPADAQFICPHGKDVRHIECGQCNAQPPTVGNWYAAEDIDRLVRELDVLLNGEHRAAPQAKLCDIVAQFRRERLSLWKGDNPSHGLRQIGVKHKGHDGRTEFIWWDTPAEGSPIYAGAPLTKGAATPEKPACACGHPAWMHETPGTECAEEDCRCTSYRCPDEKTATGMTSKDNLDMQEAVRTLSAHETEGSPK